MRLFIAVLALLACTSGFGQTTFGCTIITACNYDPSAQFEDGSCEYPEDGYDCAGACLNDSDGDGVCDEFELAGCVDPAACNYIDPAIVTDEGECTYPSSDYYDCDGNCLIDIDGDGICDEFSVYGCTDPAACNYDMNATDESGDCIYPDECGVCGGDGIGPGLCDCAGTAPNEGYDCEGVCLNDEDGDGVCDEFEVLGCTDTDAFNFNAEATEDDGCEYLNELPASWAVTPTPSSAVLIGAVELDGIPAGEEDWVGAFTEGGACAGLAQPTTTEMGSLISLIIYGDDDLTEDTVEGLSEGESFSLQYFDATTGESYQYHAENGQWLLTGWTNMNGAPLSGYNDPTTLYAFSTEPYDPPCGDPSACNYEVGGEETTSCIYPEPGLDCDGNCLSDNDIDGICDEEDPCIGAYDACGVCNGPGAIYDCGCTNIPDGDCDCDGNQVDAIGECGGLCVADIDNDGICDDVDECVGELDDCGVCNGPGAVYECGCAGTPEGDCDCEGNQLDVIGVCGGDCPADSDADGICDDVDPCVGQLDACGVCNGPGAIYECGCFDISEGACDCEGNQLDALGECGGGCEADDDADDICDDIDPCVGAYDECGVCNGSGPEDGYDCAGTCLNDFDGDGVCDEYEVSGCGYEAACNYDPNVTEDDGSCTYPETGLNCEGGCLFDADFDGICDQDEVVGCQDPAACNYDASATDSGYCDYPETGYNCDGFCEMDADGDGVCDEFEIVGCTDASACNYNCDATDEAACSYAEYGLDCQGDCLIDSDADGVCDQDEVVGCSDEAACNYEPNASDDGYCVFASEFYDCDGNCLNDENGDGVCDEFETAGCTDSQACNWVPAATDDDGSCFFAEAGYDCDGNCLVDSDGDAICDQDEVTGCQDEAACNYEVNATDTGYCVYAEAGYDCQGSCLNDADADGVCDEFETAGCTDSQACNWVPAATDDDGSCFFAEAGYDCDGYCLVDSDGDAICDQDEVTGCQDEAACNYDVNATDTGYCVYAEAGYDCQGSCLNDADADGVCDEFEIVGCTDASACNYNCDATDEAACSYADYGLDCEGNCLIDSDADGVCDQDEVVGCSDEAACNYDPNATDDGYCGYAQEFYDCDGNCLNDENGDGICDETQALIDLAMEELYGDFVVALANGEYCGDGTVWLEELQLCVAIPTCMADLDNDGNRGTEDLLMLLSVYGTGCPLIEGCTNPEADNYNPLAEADDGTCIIPTCSGNSYTYAGHTYALVEIGDQCWFAENLKTNQFSNGDLIDEVNGGFDWYQSGADGLPARTIYNGLSVNANDFGYLYNGPVALDTRGVCPTGWKVPSDEEWMMLEQHLGMNASDASNSGFRGAEEGDQLKALVTDVPSWDGMNTVEFSALPAGYRFNFGSFAGISDEALFWSQTASGSSLWTRGLESGNPQIERTLKSGGFGASIRCLKSNENE